LASAAADAALAAATEVAEAARMAAELAGVDLDQAASAEVMARDAYRTAEEQARQPA
jgi:hypothetical protein